MNKTGYAILNETQLHILYGPQSPYNNSQALQHLTSMNSSVIHNRIEADIHHTAELKSFKIRQKDIVLSPISFTNIILQPALVSQAIVLSPIIFSPAIL